MRSGDKFKKLYLRFHNIYPTKPGRILTLGRSLSTQTLKLSLTFCCFSFAFFLVLFVFVVAVSGWTIKSF